MVVRNVKIRLRRGNSKHEAILDHIDSLPTDARGTCGLSALFIDSTYEQILAKRPVEADVQSDTDDKPEHLVGASDPLEQRSNNENPLSRVTNMKFE